MADNRTSRDNETRSNEERPKHWSPPSVLPDPDPRDGWAHRWVRVAAMGQADNRNVSMKLREGWEPCRIDEYPEMQSVFDKDSHYGKRGNIEIGGLMLCRAPQELMQQRQSHYTRMADQQMEAVDNQLASQSDSRMPISKPQRTTKTTFGSR